MNALDALLVRRPGVQTSVQDLGRPGYGRYGVPVSGAMDTWSLRLGNLLLGNPPGAAALEMALVGPELEALAPLLCAYTGADLNLLVGGRPVRPGRTFRVREGELLRFGAARAGARAYLCVAGGLLVEPVLGSRSTAVTAGLGGLEGRPLLGSDILQAPVIADGAVAGFAPRRLKRPLTPQLGGPATLRLLEGPQARGMPGALPALMASTWRVSERSDRVGVRLQGPQLPRHEGSFETEGVPLGSVQVPPDGAPILLLADRQTTGGYPKPAVLASVDLPLAGQLHPGDEVRFELVTLEEAVRLLREREALLADPVWEPEGAGTEQTSLGELLGTLERSRVRELHLEGKGLSLRWVRGRRS